MQVLKSVIYVWSCYTSARLVGASHIDSQNGSRQWNFAEIPPSSTLNNWYPCFDEFTCTILEVPLDYQNSNEDKSLIPLIKYPANAKPYRGMILTNPGGPGASGIDMIRNLAGQVTPYLGLNYQHIPFLGLNYDFVSWDPRGSGFAIPEGNCSLPVNLTVPLGPSAMKRRAVDKLHGPSLPQAYFENVYEVASAEGQACSQSIGGPKEAGPHMSTTTIARDIISILDAYAETEGGKSCKDASLLNYWGLSYGTFLGQVFASMFPDRVGRVVLDGVLDPDEVTKGSGLKMVTLADDALSTFFLYCHLAGPACPFYTGSTAHDIYLRFEAIINQLNVTQALEENWNNSTAIWIVLQGIKGYISTATYHAIDQFPVVAQLLYGAEALLPNISLEVLQAVLSQWPADPNPPISLNSTWATGTSCADNGGIYLGRNISYWANSIRTFEMESWVAGESQVVNQMFCSSWNITTASRYTGPFGGKTKNPILFVSNTLDPITPIENGRNGVRIFQDAQLLTVEGVGHTSLSTYNKCVLAKIGTYLMNGTLPGMANYCALEAGPWNVIINGTLARNDEVLRISGQLEALR